MFCQNCGIELEDNTKFCTSCGQDQTVQANGPVEQNQYQPQQSPPPVYSSQPQPQYQAQQPMYNQPIRKEKSKIPAVIIAVIIIALAGVLVYGYMQSTPEAAANKLFTAVLHKDGGTALNNIYFEKGLTAEKKEYFKKSISTNSALTTVDVNYLQVSAVKPSTFTGTISASLTVDGKETKDFKVLYVSIKESGKISTDVIYMLKQGKNFLIFDRWVAYVNLS